MKYLLFILLLMTTVVCRSQSLVKQLLDSSPDSISYMMQKQLPKYQMYKPKVDSIDVKRLEFSLMKDSTSDTGILVYLFYFENPAIDKCTGIRIVWYDEDVFKKYFQLLTLNSDKVGQNLWFDKVTNTTLSTFFAHSDSVTFFFMDIQRPKN